MSMSWVAQQLKTLDFLEQNVELNYPIYYKDVLSLEQKVKNHKYVSCVGCYDFASTGNKNL